MTPIFIRIWLMKMTSVFERLIFAVSFRRACDMSRAWRPICGSPISPSISAFGDDGERKRRLARGFGTVDLDHASAWETPDAEREIESQRARRDDLDVFRNLRFAEPHDRAFAELLLDLRERRRQRFDLVLVH